MSVLKSEIKTNSSEFKENNRGYLELLETLRAKTAESCTTRSKKAIELSRKRGKLLTEERIAAVVDQGSSILELGALAGMDMYDGVAAGSGLRTCIGKVAGRICMIVANNPAVKGGTYFPTTVKKHLRAQDIARENRLPCIYLVDSGGAFLPLQAEVFPDRHHFGRIFFNQARMSSAGIAQISAVLGSCTAGGAYVPAMSDETVMTRENASIFLGGPPLVKAATGEEIDTASLGGADVHCRISGVADHLADDELDALRIVRQIVGTIGSEDGVCPNWRRLQRSRKPEPPKYDPAEIYGIVGSDLKKTFAVKEVLARLLDGSRFSEFKSEFGQTIKCGFGHIQGFQVGIIANDGILFSESALKAAHFMELCSKRAIPILFLQNIVGFMVGKKYEHEGIAKHGAKMVTAVATAEVPKLTMTIGGSYGAGNYSMCGRAYDPRFLFTWPNSRISVMGGEQAAKVLGDVRLNSLSRKGEKIDESENLKYQDSIREKYELEGSPYYASARLWDDGLIDPALSRDVLALALASIGFEAENKKGFGVFRM